MKRIKKTKEKDTSRFFSMQANPDGASVGNFVNNVKAITSPIVKPVKKAVSAYKNYAKNERELTAEAENQYKKSQGGSYSVNEGTIGEIMKIKKNLKKSKKK
jgi:hypothetical protein